MLTDGSGRVDCGELQRGLLEMGLEIEQQTIDDIFEVLDKDPSSC